VEKEIELKKDISMKTEFLSLKMLTQENEFELLVWCECGRFNFDLLKTALETMQRMTLKALRQVLTNLDNQ
jgi:hypothetical protein